jgi:hypothetical protein
MTKTQVVTYNTEHAMNSDIKRREQSGWSVMSTQRVPQGWGVAKTTLLGLIYLPLAIFGKKRDLFQVTYQMRDAPSNTQYEEITPKFSKTTVVFMTIALSLLAILCLLIFALQR